MLGLPREEHTRPSQKSERHLFIWNGWAEPEMASAMTVRSHSLYKGLVVEGTWSNDVQGRDVTRSTCLLSTSHIRISVAPALPRAGTGISRHGSQSLVSHVPQATFHMSLSMWLNLNSHIHHPLGTYQAATDLASLYQMHLFNKQLQLASGDNHIVIMNYRLRNLKTQ